MYILLLTYLAFQSVVYLFFTSIIFNITSLLILTVVNVSYYYASLHLD